MDHSDPIAPNDPAWLASPAAEVVLDRAGALVAAHPDDPLSVGATLRREHPGLPPARAAAVLEQAHLRRLADRRYGLAADDLLLTRDGLEQATRPPVAARRARALRAAGAERVLDLTGGLGFDARAMLAEGLDVTVLEADPSTAVLLAHNAPGATVRCADATAPGVIAGLLGTLGPLDVVFVDPARRDPVGPRDLATARSRPERDPGRWSPPWPFVAAIPHPRVAAKVAPSFQPPAGWQAEWVSVQRSVVECALYSWPIGASTRRAVLITGDIENVIDGHLGTPPAIADGVGAWLHEPDPAVIRAGAIPDLLALCPGTAALDEHSSWLTGDALPPSGLGVRSFRVVVELSGGTKQMRRALAEHGVRSLTVKSRDVAADPARVLRSLDRPEGAGHVLVLTRRAGRPISLLVEPAAPRSG